MGVFDCFGCFHEAHSERSQTVVMGSATSPTSAVSCIGIIANSRASGSNHVNENRVLERASSMASSAFFSACSDPAQGGLPTFTMELDCSDEQPSSSYRFEGMEEERKKVIRKVTDLIHQHRACRACGALLEYVEGSGQDVRKLQPDFEALGIDIVRMLDTTSRLQAAVTNEKDDKGWNKVSTGDLDLFYQHDSGSPVHGFRARCILDCPAEHILCISREFDLSKEWNKFCTVSQFLEEYSATDVLVHGTLWAPWPLSNIDLIAAAVGTDLLEEHNCMVIDVGMPDKLPDNLPTSWNKNMKLRVRQGSFILFEPLLPGPDGKPRTRVCATISADVGIKHVPEFLIAFVLRILAPFMYSTVVSMLQRIFSPESTSKLAERLEQRVDLYPIVKRRVKRFLEDKALAGGGAPA